jgi:hypothetical protein
MPVIAVDPIILGNAKLTLGANDYEGHVSSAVFTPTDNAPVTWKGLTPTSKFSFGKAAVWTLDLEYAQDWETADSLAKYLLANEGEEVAAVFEPVNGGQGYTATVIVTPGPIGGAVDAVAVGTVSLGVKGVPTPVA